MAVENGVGHQVQTALRALCTAVSPATTTTAVVQRRKPDASQLRMGGVRSVSGGVPRSCRRLRTTSRAATTAALAAPALAPVVACAALAASALAPVVASSALAAAPFASVVTPGTAPAAFKV